MLRPVDIFKAVVAICGSLLLLYLIYLLRTPITWIFIAAFLSLALHPIVSVLSRWMPRGLATALVMIGLIGLLGGLVLILLPPLIEQGGNLVDRAPHWLDSLREYVNHNQTLQAWENRYGLSDKLKDLSAKAPGFAQDAAGGVLDALGTAAQEGIGLITVLVMTVFMLNSGPRWGQWIVEQAPAGRHERWRAITDHLGEAVSGYLLGNLLISFIAGLGSYIVLLILGVPYAGALAVMVGIMDLLPIVGSLLASILVGLVTLAVDFPTASIVWTIWAIAYQQVENHLLQPQIYKRTVNVHPLMVIIAILFGGTLLGILGALIAIPVAASAQFILRNWWNERGRDQLLPAPEDGLVEPAAQKNTTKD